MATKTSAAATALRPPRSTTARKARAASTSAASAPAATTSRKRAAPHPAITQPQPGHEHLMECRPQFFAPHYRGSGKLQGMTALITGGDSGIGRAVAALFAREGANVAIAYLNEDKDAKATRKYVQAEGAQCILLPGDVRDPAYCEQAVRKTIKKWGALNILVNNAACQEASERLEDLSDAQIAATFETNIYGYLHMARAALPHMHQGDCIINTGSITGIRGSAYLLDYAASKGAIHTFTKSLAANVAERGIRVNAVAPGPVWTPLNPATGSEDDIANFGSCLGMGRPAQPEEISPAYVFLASPACSSYLTGVILPITGCADD